MSEYKVGGISSIFASASKKRKHDEIKSKDDEDSSNEDSEVKFEQENSNSVVPSHGDDVIVKKKRKPEEKKKKVKLESKKATIAKRNADKRAEDENRTVFVGNVPSTVRDREVKSLFREYGVIESVYSRSLLQKNDKLTLKVVHTDKSMEPHLTTKNFYVRFKEPKNAQEAVMKMNGHKWKDHNLRVSMAGQTQLTGANTIFIGNLIFEAEDQAIQDFFEENCGPVKAVRLIRNKVTGKTTGIGYVSFHDYDSVVKALEMDGTKYAGRPLRISRLLSQHKRPAGTKRFAQSSYREMVKANAEKSKKVRMDSNRKKQKMEAEAEKIAKFSTFKKEQILNKKSGGNNAKKPAGGPSKGVRKVIKKRKHEKRKSLMT